MFKKVGNRIEGYTTPEWIKSKIDEMTTKGFNDDKIAYYLGWSMDELKNFKKKYKKL